MKRFLLLFSAFVYCMSASAQERYKVLVFSKTAGYRHTSIGVGLNAIKKLGVDNQFGVDATEDASKFTLPNLQKYQAIVFLSTTGNVLDTVQQKAFEQYIAQGGGFVGIHAAADTEYDWPWYGGLVGAYFDSHPAGTPSAVVKVSDHVHPSTAHLPATWPRTDEWYNYGKNPRGKVHVLATLQESSYTGGNMGADHPIAWCHRYMGGKAWYTGGGHTDQSYSDPAFLQHIYGGIQYATGAVVGQFDATDESNLSLSVVDPDPNQPVMMEVLSDGKVLYIERGGTLKLYNPATAVVKLAGKLKVDSQREDGLIGLATDPNYNANHWIYLFYSPAGTTPIQRISRFVFQNDTLHTKTEQIVITIPVQRAECCHSGGALTFDAQGNLYIAVGDNTNPFSTGYSPTDETAGRSSFDAQRTSGNTKDLRGKILRITPQANGTYTIPTGNLFSDTSVGKPEIFVMGTRNPYRISVDKQSGYLYWGDVGPDGDADGPGGSRGYDEFNRTNTAGNFGWPYCIANNRSYIEYDYTAKAYGKPYDCSKPINNSPNNTGALELPPAKSAWIWYNYGVQTDFPAIGNGSGRTAMAGPVYDYDPNNPSKIKLPAYFDKSVFVYDWSNNWVKEIKVDEAGNPIAINPFLTTFRFSRPIDMKIGHDGAIYIIEWGAGYFSDNPDARIVRIGFAPEQKNPTAVITATPAFGASPLKVNFSAKDSKDEDVGNTLSYYWDFQNDGVEDATGLATTYTYSTPGVHIAKLRVVDNTGLQAFTTQQFIVGNEKPQVEILQPLNGGFIDWKDSVHYQVKVTDAEDGSTTLQTIRCDDLVLLPALGHNDHGHDENLLQGCSGDLQTPSGHGEAGSADNIFYVLNATYQDKGAKGNSALALTGTTASLLRPKRLEAEYFSKQKNISVAVAHDVYGGGSYVGTVDHGDFITFQPINLAQIHQVTYRVASNGKAGYIEMHADSANGLLLSKRFIPSNNSDQFYDFYTATVDDPGRTMELYLVFKSVDGLPGQLFNLNWIDFYGNGVATPHLEKQGLKATYFPTSDFNGFFITRYEPVVAHHWENAKPLPTLPSDAFSVEWSGFLIPPTTGAYTFSLPATNGVAELWLDGLQLIGSPSTESTAKQLTANRYYPIKIRYAHSTGAAEVKLQWQYGTFKRNVIPQISLAPRLIDGTLSVSDQEWEKETVRLYPNPSKGEIVIDGGRTSIEKIAIQNVQGTILMEQNQVFEGVKRMDVSSLPNGLYLVKISTGTTETTKKIVVNK